MGSALHVLRVLFTCKTSQKQDDTKQPEKDTISRQKDAKLQREMQIYDKVTQNEYKKKRNDNNQMLNNHRDTK